VDVEEKRRKMIPGQIVCIGRFCPNDVKNVERMFRRTSHLGDNLTFIFIGRLLNKEDIGNDYPNIVVKSWVETPEMIQTVIESEYLYISDMNMEHIKYSMSGAIPLALSCLCKLILPAQMNEHYQFRSAITYDISTGDSSTVDDSIQVVSDELDRLVHRKFEAFDKFVRKVPRVIFQTWETKDFSPEFQAIVDKWKEMNPSYKYFLYDRLEREEFIRTHFPGAVYNAYRKIVPGAFKADLWRYCVLYVYGGVYTDVDMLCMGKLDDFIARDIDMVVPVDLNANLSEGRHNLSNGFFAVKPRCEILLQCITRIVHNVMNGIIPASLLDICGPGMLGRATNIVLGREETASFVGMEGLYSNRGYNIHFLKFDGDTEYMQDTCGNVILQNKNKNPEIQRLYQLECQKVNTVCWMGTKPY
jgi:mannosyltransferase OCH1-like enzyme